MHGIPSSCHKLCKHRAATTEGQHSECMLRCSASASVQALEFTLSLVCRRADTQPFLAIAGNASDGGGLGDFVHVAAVNTAAAGLESALGRRLYPFT